MATPTIKALLDEIRATLAGVAVLKAVVRPPEMVPPDGPFALVEFGGAEVTFGSLEETVFTVIVRVCVPMLGAYPQECEAVEAAAGALLPALRGNVEVADAVLLPGISLGATGGLTYAQVPLVSVPVTVQYQALSERVTEIGL